MVEENEKGRGGGRKEGREGGRERRAHESQEVVVIVTESLYLSIRSISGILLLWKKTAIRVTESFFTEAKLSANTHALVLANCKAVGLITLTPQMRFQHSCHSYFLKILTLCESRMAAGTCTLFLGSCLNEFEVCLSLTGSFKLI